MYTRDIKYYQPVIVPKTEQNKTVPYEEYDRNGLKNELKDKYVELLFDAGEGKFKENVTTSFFVLRGTKWSELKSCIPNSQDIDSPLGKVFDGYTIDVPDDTQSIEENLIFTAKFSTLPQEENVVEVTDRDYPVAANYMRMVFTSGDEGIFEERDGIAVTEKIIDAKIGETTGAEIKSAVGNPIAIDNAREFDRWDPEFLADTEKLTKETNTDYTALYKDKESNNLNEHEEQIDLPSSFTDRETSPMQKDNPQTRPMEEPEEEEGIFFDRSRDYLLYSFSLSAPQIKETKKIEPAKELVEQHRKYISGYPNGTVQPSGNITRAEAAAMIVRLKGMDDNNKTLPNFTDTKEAKWYDRAVNAVVAAGYMKGYPDGSFKPNQSITRAEFVALIAAFDKVNDAKSDFTDVKGHWAQKAIDQAFGNKRIGGYPDGTFKPNQNITRAEAAKILNSMFDRVPDKSFIDNNESALQHFTDLNKSHWAYDEMVEATNDHHFVRQANNGEVWNEIVK